MKTAILVPAHNEAANIAATLRSTRGYDTYVVSDSSTDDTVRIARRFRRNVIEVERGGKGRALKALIEHFNIIDKYDAFVILDADTVLDPGAVEAFEAAMKPGVGGAVGNMLNSGTSLFACWRSIQYLQVFTFYRRGQAAMNTIFVMCGTCSIWSTKLFKQLSWHDTPVEDMDHTYQLHRGRIGKIAYASKASVHTLEPTSLGDYSKQMLRWMRGFWLTTAKYKTPFGRQSLDFGQALLFLETALNWSRWLILPFLVFVHGLLFWWAVSIGSDILVITIFAIYAAFLYRKWVILLMLPLFPLMFALDTGINMWSFLTYGKLKTGHWTSPRRKTVSRKDNQCTETSQQPAAQA